MNIYDLFMKPFEDKGLRVIRKELMKNANGVVLELGVGTGANLLFYNERQIDKLILTDLEKRVIVENKQKSLPFKDKIVYETADVQFLNQEDNSIDTVVASLIFCSVPDVLKGLEEIKRVLKPDGKLLFIEHVISPNQKLARVMNFFTPAWKRIAHGCHLNRDYIKYLEKSGYEVLSVKQFWKNIFISGIAIVKD